MPNNTLARATLVFSVDIDPSIKDNVIRKHHNEFERKLREMTRKKKKTTIAIFLNE